MTHHTDLAPLVRSLVIAPAGRYRVAQALADMHDGRGGELRATMGQIAAAAGLSKVQTRKHVHALIAEGLLVVAGNAFGGSPGAGPVYVFNRGLLEHLAARTPDLFSGQHPGAAAEQDGAHRFAINGAQFLAMLVGAPGTRRVVFWRVDGEHAYFGDVPLKVLLRNPSVRGCWHFHLTPDGEPDVPYDQAFGLSREQGMALATWAQNTALGRVESLVAA